MSHAITLRCDGTATAVYSDDFPLTYLGPMRVARASVITWNEATQLWDVAFRDEAGEFTVKPDGADGHATYAAAIEYEVEYLSR